MFDFWEIIIRAGDIQNAFCVDHYNNFLELSSFCGINKNMLLRDSYVWLVKNVTLILFYFVLPVKGKELYFMSRVVFIVSNSKNILFKTMKMQILL